MLLNNGGRSFGFKVDPTNLGPGFHFAQVLAYDTLNKEAGPLFQIPITICKPEQVMSQGIFKANAVEFEPGTIHRQFFDVPANANFAQLIIKSKRRDTTSRLYVHLIQLQNVKVEIELCSSFLFFSKLDLKSLKGNMHLDYHQPNHLMILNLVNSKRNFQYYLESHSKFV